MLERSGSEHGFGPRFISRESKGDARSTYDFTLSRETLIVTHRISHAAVDVARDVCLGKNDLTICMERMKGLPNGNPYSCPVSSSHPSCRGYVAGNNVISRFEWLCREHPVERTPSASTSSETIGLAAWTTVRLRNWLTIEIPATWQISSTEFTGTVAAWTQAGSEVRDGFLANLSHPEAKRSIATLNVRFYENQPITQSTVQSLSTTEIATFDSGVRAGFDRVGFEPTFGHLKWHGTTRIAIAGISTLVTSFQRIPATGPVNVRLFRVLHGPRSFTITVSYDDDSDPISRPIVDRIANSFRITQ